MGSEPDITADSPQEPGSPRTSLLLRAYFEHYALLVRFMARRLKCVATARDLVQEVYFRILRVSPDEPIDNPRAFLFQVAANLTADHRRVEGRRAELLEGVQELLWGPDEEISPERQVLATDELAYLDGVLALIPEPTRGIFALNRFEHLTQREIAERLGISISTVEKHIRIALQRLYDARNQYDAGVDAEAGTAPDLLSLPLRFPQPG